MLKNLKLKSFFEKYAIYLVLIIEIVLFSILSPYFLSVDNLINILRQVSIVGIMAVGMTFVILTGGIDLSIGGVVACVGVICAKLMVNGVHPIFAILVSLIFAALVGLINAVFSHEFKLIPMIVTLATLQILKGISYIITGAIPVFGFTEGFKVIGQGYLGPIPIPIIIMLVLYVIAYIILTYTSFGQSIYAIGGNEEAVRLTGINIRKQKYLAYILCSLITAVAGIVLLSRVNTAQPSAGIGYEMDVITGAVLGGISMSGGEGKITGVFAGVLVMAILSNGMLMMSVSEYWQWVAKGIVMLMAITYDKILKRGKV
ncbi:MAG: ABC transporter permease [Erysipelotrichaceae bacterium]